MIARIGIGVEEASLPVRVDLHLNCAECREHRLCRKWLASGGDDAAYRIFCPNGQLLNRLIQIQRWRRTSRVPSKSQSINDD